MHILVSGLLIVAVSTVFSDQISDSDIEVVNQYDIRDENGFKWGFDLSDGRKTAQNGELRELPDGSKILVMNGSYSFVGPDGVEYLVEYFADETGYHPNVKVNPNQSSPKLQTSKIPHFQTPPTSKYDYMAPPTPPTPPRPSYGPLHAAFTTESSVDPKALISLVGG